MDQLSSGSEAQTADITGELIAHVNGLRSVYLGRSDLAPRLYDFRSAEREARTVRSDRQKVCIIQTGDRDRVDKDFSPSLDRRRELLCVERWKRASQSDLDNQPRYQRPISCGYISRSL